MSARWLCLGFAFVVVSACSPSRSTTAPPASPTAAQATAEPSLPPAPLAPATTSTKAPPSPTLSPWDEVQTQVRQLRNKLGSASDGYQGLTIALDQSEANDAWCGGLSSGIADFLYLGDQESAGTLTSLSDDQGCP